jgi:hypothetical protein
MSTKVKVKRQMTGKELAALLYHSGFKWNNVALHRKGDIGQRDSYCLLGQIARIAGYSNEIIDHASEEDSNIPEINDDCKTRAELRRRLCTEHGDEVFYLDSFLEGLEYARDSVEGG